MSLLGTAICDIAPGSHQDRIALLMLPAAKTTPQQLVEHGFIQAVRARGQPADVIALNAHADYYLERAGIERLLHETLDEVRARGYRRIWLLGISLGGLVRCFASPSARRISRALCCWPRFSVQAASLRKCVRGADSASGG